MFKSDEGKLSILCILVYCICSWNVCIDGKSLLRIFEQDRKVVVRNVAESRERFLPLLTFCDEASGGRLASLVGRPTIGDSGAHMFPPRKKERKKERKKRTVELVQ